MSGRRTPGRGGSVPRSVGVLIAGLTGAGLLTGWTAGGLAGGAAGGAGAPWLGVVGLAVGLLVAGTLQLQVQHGDDVEGLDLFDAVLVPLVFALPGPWVIALVAATKLGSQLQRRVAGVKAAFNVAQWVAAAGAASLVVAAVGGRGPFTPAAAAALALAFLVATVVNHLAVLVVLRLTGTRTLRQVAADRASALPVTVTGGLANLAFGLVFAGAWAAAPDLSLLFVVPLAMLHWASRGHAEVRADRARLAGMERATRALHRPVDPRDALGDLLVEVRTAFESARAELVLATGDGGVVVSCADAHGPSVRALDGAAATAWRAALAALAGTHRAAPGDGGPLDLLARHDGWTNALVAPLRDGDAVVGAVCTYDRRGLEGFGDGELAVLDVLASEVSAALHKGRLLDAILEERRRFSEIVTRASDGIATLAADGAVLSWNPGFAAITGWSAAEVATALDDRLDPRDGDGAAVRLGRWATAGDDLPGELRVRTSAGDERWLACSYSRVDDDGAPRLILIGRDVTEARRLAEARAELLTAGARLAAAQESEQRFRALVHHSSDVVAVADAAGVVRWSSLETGSARTALGPLLPGMDWLDLVHPGDRADVRRRLAGLGDDADGHRRVVHRATAAGGGWRHVETVVTDLLDDPAVGGVVLNVRDVTEELRGQTLLASERRILTLVANDEDLPVTLSAVVAAIEEQLPGADVAIVLHDGDARADRAEAGGGHPLVLAGRPLAAEEEGGLRAAIAGGTGPPRRGAAGAGRLADDVVDLRPRWRATPLSGGDGGRRGSVAVRPAPGRALSARDADVVEVLGRLATVAVERHRARHELSHRATHDALTDLPNRATFLDRLEMALGRAARSQRWTAVLFCDLDGFKAVNDTYGHDAGDRVLVEVAHRLAGAVRPGDTVSRLGGDEFTLLCEALDDPDQARVVADRVRAVLAQPHVVAGEPVAAGASVGVAVVQGPGSAVELVERADAAMYEAKRAGGSRSVVVQGGSAPAGPRA